MAVRASATITLNSVVDIKATYRYYLLQSSTASKPVKPTANPPGGSWDDAEPTYTSGSTNSLYFVDLTVFSDDSFRYSEVSKSTSYEAAKEAYNKATNAQNSVDNLEIGGRNLFSGYGEEEIELGNYQNRGSFTQFVNCLTFNPCETVGETYTISFWAKSPNGSTSLSIYNQNGNPRHFFFASRTLTESLGDTWIYFKTTVINTDRGESGNADTLCNRIEIYAPDQLGVLVKKIKVEKGNKATDWTPAPEDIDAAIEDVKAVTITGVDVLYALSTSSATAPTSGWSTTAPSWVSGKYMWQKTVTTYGDGTTSESATTCISGAAGQAGSIGTGVVSISEEYYLSTSKTTQTDGSWSATAPTWSPGKYIWTRSKIVYRNPSATDYTTPICDSSWEAVNDLEIGGANMLQYTDTSKYGIEYWSTWSSSIEIVSDDYMKVTITTGANNFGAYGSTKSAKVIQGHKYAISFDGYADSELNLSYCYLMGTNGNTSLFGLGFSPALSTEPKKISFTFVAPSSGTYSVMLAASNTTNYTGSFYFKNLKLEKGNKATDWTPAPEDVKVEIDDASKTAKNFLDYSSDNGLQVGNKTGGAWSGFRTQIKSNAFNILNAAGTVLASYGEKLIELGKNATDAVIKLCGGKGQIEYVTDEDNNTDYIQMYSDRVRIKSSEMSSVYSMYTDNSTRWEKSAVNVSPNKVEIYASECIDPTLPEHVEGWHTTRIDIESGNVSVETPGTVAFDCEGVYDTHGRLMSVVRGVSGIWNYSKWSDGTVELWGVYSISNKACNAALGSMYRTDAFQPDIFPFVVYSPKLVASYESSGYGAMLWATAETTTSRPPSYYLIRPTSGTIASGKIIFHVTGTWA